MKKIMYFAFAIAMACTFTACGNSTKGNAENADSLTADSALNAENDSISNDSVTATGAETSVSQSKGSGNCRFCSCKAFNPKHDGYGGCWCGHHDYVHN